MGKPHKHPTKHQEYCYLLYDAMHQLSEVEDNGLRMYRGYVTYLLETLEVPKPHWFGVPRRLVVIGAVECVEAGRRNVLSEYVLLKHPSEISEGWQEPLTARPPDDKLSEVEQRIRDLIDSLGGIDIGEALRNHEDRLQHLEAQLAQEATGKAG